MRRVLVVDDNAVNRKLATAILKRRGWEVEEVDNGFSALELLKASTFDYVLLDISMPGIDGEEVCRRLRQMEHTKGLYVVAYTAHALETEKQRIMEAGFNDIVIKPITMDLLLSKFPD